MSHESDMERAARLEATAKAMRELDDDAREEAIVAAGVLDLRPRLAERVKQRHLAAAYRAPPGGGVA